MATKTIKVPAALTRSATLEVKAEGDKKTLRVSVSSDTPYKRYDWWDDEYYWEVLDHGPGGLDDERLKNGLPILFNHDRDAHLARAMAYENDGHKLTVGEFIWASGDFADQKRTDMESGALPDTSVGYEIVGDGVCVGAKDEIPIYKFKWRIHEASAVTIPADITVGVGRQRGQKPEGEPRELLIRIDNQPVLTNSIDSSSDQHQNRSTTRSMPDSIPPVPPEVPKVDAKQERQAAVAEERKRVEDIAAFSKSVSESRKIDLAAPTAEHIRDGKSLTDFREWVLMNEFKANPLQTPTSESSRGNGHSSPSSRGGRELVSIGDAFVNSKEFKAAQSQRGSLRSAGVEYDISILGIRGKVAMATRAGFTSSDLSAVNVQIQTGVIALGMQRLTIMDLIAPGTTGAASIIYPRENSYGSVDGVAVSGAGVMPRAKSVGERGLKPSWEPDLTTETATVKKIAITTKVPDEFMSDFPAARSYIDERMPFMVDTETEFQILYGDGLGNNLKGIFTTAGVQTRAITVTDDSTKAASLRQGLTDVAVGSFFEADGFAFHPYDWETACLLKDTTGRFLAGGPYYIPYTNGVFMELHTFWGKPVVVSTAVTYGKPLAGAWKLGAQYFIREGMRIEMTNANEDDFRRNLIALRAEHRLALAIYRPPSFIEYTGFPARA